MTCTEAEGSDTIVSYNYTINGVFQGTSELLSHRNCMCFNELGLTGTGGEFPIVIGKEDLDLGENTVKIVFTSARRATVELEILLRNFNVICSARSTSDSEYVEISCVLRESSQTIAGVTYAINGVDKGALQGMLVSYT